MSSAERRTWAALVLGLAVIIALGIRQLLHSSSTLPEISAAPDFALTERSGRTISRRDLAGRVWIADFFFTRCPTLCVTMSSNLARLQTRLPGRIAFVSFTVDPEFDTPEVLQTYARRWRAEEGRWFFLTGPIQEITKVSLGFRLAGPTEGSSPHLITHSNRFVLVDAAGKIRGYFFGDDPDEVRKLETAALSLLPGISSLLPHVNAALNALSAVCLVAGFARIRKKQIHAHRLCMVGALALSVLFLVSYVVYHWQAGSRPFQGEGAIRYLYLAILVSHIVLAALIVPLALVTLGFAVRERFDRHRALARWTFPLWLYVSVSGVAVYLLLYHWPFA